MSWPGGRSRQRSGTCVWRSGDRRRYWLAGGGSFSCCSAMIRLLEARAAGEPARGRRRGAPAAGPGRRSGRGAARPGRGPARAGVDQPSHHRAIGPARFDEAERHLEQGVALARRIGRSVSRVQRPGEPGGGRDSSGRFRRRPSAPGKRSSWPGGTAGPTRRPPTSPAWYSEPCWPGRDGPRRQSPWLQQAERAIRDEAEPVAGLGIRYARGVLELARGRDADALAAFQAAEQLTGRLAAPNPLGAAVRAMLAQILVRLGETEHAEQAHRRARRARSANVGRFASATGDAAARPGRPARRDGCARPGPGRLRPAVLAGLAYSGVPAGGDRPGHARRPRRSRKRPRARTRPGRTRRRAVVVPAGSRAGSARAPCRAAHRPRRPDRRDPQPAGRPDARIAARRGRNRRSRR